MAPGTKLKSADKGKKIVSEIETPKIPLRKFTHIST